MPGLGGRRAGAVLGRHPREGAAPVRPGHRRRPVVAAAAAVRVVRAARVGRRGLALVDGFYSFDFATGETAFLAGPADQPPGTRFNDGKVSPDGRFFAGTMDEKTAARADRRRSTASTRTGACTRSSTGSSCRTAWPGAPTARRCSTPTARARSSGPTPTTPRTGAARRAAGCSPAPPRRSAGPTAAPRTSRATTGAAGISAGRPQPVGARRDARPQHPAAGVEPDLPLLRRPRPQDDLRDVAAPRPARRRPRREARLGRHRRAAGRRRRGTRRPLRGV